MDDSRTTVIVMVIFPILWILGWDLVWLLGTCRIADISHAEMLAMAWALCAVNTVCTIKCNDRYYKLCKLWKKYLNLFFDERVLRAAIREDDLKRIAAESMKYIRSGIYDEAKFRRAYDLYSRMMRAYLGAYFETRQRLGEWTSMHTPSSKDERIFVAKAFIGLSPGY